VSYVLLIYKSTLLIIGSHHYHHHQLQSDKTTHCRRVFVQFCISKKFKRKVSTAHFLHFLFFSQEELVLTGY